VGSERRSVPLVLPDLHLELETDRGVFSRDRIDPGTKLLLLEAPMPPPEGHLLDLGCGYGPLALTLARRAPGATVWAVDSNRRAVALTADNARSAGLANVRAVEPDGVPDGIRFATLWSNPPVRLGKGPLQGLLRRWLARLVPGATALLVVHKHLGADSLARWCDAEGHTTRRLVSRMGYRVLEVGGAGRDHGPA
jgi:16S rRNA (guanine1207-N2)-methyltransferase